MAFGDHPEAALLLPGGSRVEGFKVQDPLSAPPVSARRRRAAILVLSTVAAVACLATIAVRGNVQDPVELEGKPVVQKSPISLASEGNLPSWLQTGPVKVVPLKFMIKEQEIARAEAKGKISDKLAQAEEAAAHEGPSPRTLAMKNAHILAGKKQSLHAQAATKVQAHKNKVAHAVHTTAQVKEAAPAAAAKADAPVTKKPEAKAAEKPKTSVPEELKEKKAELQKIMSGEKAKEDEIKKAEVHQLAMLKKADKQREAALNSEISKLEQEQTGEISSEKAKLKAQMAQIEAEEHAKLEALKKKMGDLGSGAEKQAAAPKQAVSSAKKATAAVKGSRAHKVVAKAAVKVHTEAEAEEKKPALAAPRARKQQLAWGHESEDGKKANCNDDNCSLKKEDKKWLAHKASVDKFADEAMKGSGKAKAQALARMRALQKQIENDYQHVTKFAVTQEYALPPVQK